MAENQVLHVRITPDEDRQLQEIAPVYLKGGGKREQRVRWAIDEFLKLTGAGQPKDPKGDSKALATS